MVAITYAQLPKSVKKGQRILVQDLVSKALGNPGGSKKETHHVSLKGRGGDCGMSAHVSFSRANDLCSSSCACHVMSLNSRLGWYLHPDRRGMR